MNSINKLNIAEHLAAEEPDISVPPGGGGDQEKRVNIGLRFWQNCFFYEFGFVRRGVVMFTQETPNVSNVSADFLCED